MKNVIKFFTVLFLFSLNASAQGGSTVAAAENEISENTRLMETALNDGDYQRFASFFSEDAILKLSGSEPFKGREAIAQAHKPMAENGMQIELTSEEKFPGEDFVTEMGSYKINTPDGQQVDFGSFMTLWKNDNGEWKIFRDVISSSAGAGK